MGMPLQRRLQLGLIASGAILYALCLTQPTWCYWRDPQSTVELCVSGWANLAYGIFGLGASAANRTWLANPLLLLSSLAVFWSPRPFAICAGVAALAVAVSFAFMHEVTYQENGGPNAIHGLRAGYWLWLASMVPVIVAALLPRPKP